MTLENLVFYQVNSISEALEGHFDLLLITYYLLLITYHLLLITNYLLLTTYHLLLTCYYLVERIAGKLETL